MHKDLRDDLTSNNVLNEFQLYISLKDFVEKNIEKGIHSFNHDKFQEKYGNMLEDFATDAGINTLNELPIHECKVLLEEDDYPQECIKHMERISFVDFEGVEYPEIVNFTEVSGDDIYIEYRFTLLTVVAKLVIPIEEYFGNIIAFDKVFINAELEGMESHVETYFSADFEASVIFNTRSEQILEFSIDTISFHRRR